MKTWIQLLAGVVTVAVGSFLVAEAMDFYPFRIHDWISVVIGAGVSIYGWSVFGEAWDAL